MKIRVLRLPNHGDLPLPHYLTPGSAGMDVYAACTSEMVIEPGERAAVPTGLVVTLPMGWELQARSRADWALEHGIVVANALPSIDRRDGEIEVTLLNISHAPFTIQRGDAIAQLVMAQVIRVEWEEVPEPDPPSTLGGAQRGSGLR